jgi:hypothetical protein
MIKYSSSLSLRSISSIARLKKGSDDFRFKQNIELQINLHPYFSLLLYLLPPCPPKGGKFSGNK